MTQPITLSPEQFQELLAATKRDAGVGVGMPGIARGVLKTGLGSCAGGDYGSLNAGVYSMLAAGSPRLALAKAWGVPLAPYCVNVRASFPTASTTSVPDVGSDVKIVQDTLIDQMIIRTQNTNTLTGSFDSLRDFFFTYQSGIEATLDVMGAPRYNIAPKFTPLSTIADVVGGSHWPGGWILTYQQQLFMSFSAKVTLPAALIPLNVICTFRGWVPTDDMFVDMRNRDAIAELAKLGIVCDEMYTGRACR